MEALHWHITQCYHALNAFFFFGVFGAFALAAFLTLAFLASLAACKREVYKVNINVLTLSKSLSPAEVFGFFDAFFFLGVFGVDGSVGGADC